MEINELQNKLVAILGYGVEGKATTNYLIKHGIKPVLFDQRPWEHWDKEEKEEIKKLGLNFIFGPDYFKELAGFDFAFRSPGVKLTEPDLLHWQKKGLQISSQTKYFFEHCPAKIIGITGTKGKGTTSALIHEILLKDGKSSFLTGNIGKVQPLEILEGLSKTDFVVYELSSFQLQDLTQSPHVGVVLMTTSEHLDYHKDEKEYVTAKTPIVKFQNKQDFAIINKDYKNSVEIGKLGAGKKIFFTRALEVTADCYVKGGFVICEDFRFDIVKLQLKGEHNLENVCAAVLATKSVGCSNDSITKALSKFQGLEHRLEFVAEKQGIKFYNDSFSTTPETAIAAIKSFTEPEILILGGSSKNSDFSELSKTINNWKNIKAIILIGEEGEKIKKQLSFSGQILEGAKDMAEIFLQIKTVASKNDVVLLSPACASFGMFKNYQDRGEQFKKFVNNFV